MHRPHMGPPRPLSPRPPSAGPGVLARPSPRHFHPHGSWWPKPPPPMSPGMGESRGKPNRAVTLKRQIVPRAQMHGFSWRWVRMQVASDLCYGRSSAPSGSREDLGKGPSRSPGSPGPRTAVSPACWSHCFAVERFRATWRFAVIPTWFHLTCSRRVATSDNTQAVVQTPCFTRISPVFPLRPLGTPGPIQGARRHGPHVPQAPRGCDRFSLSGTSRPWRF